MVNLADVMSPEPVDNKVRYRNMIFSPAGQLSQIERFPRVGYARHRQENGVFLVAITGEGATFVRTDFEEVL